MNDEEFYEIQDFLFGGISCEWDKRKQCDSLYIEKYERLENKLNKIIEMLDKYCSDEYLIAVIKEIILKEE